jgi:hypothetical protein
MKNVILGIAEKEETDKLAHESSPKVLFYPK